MTAGRVVVLGGGISGLVAALDLADAGAEVTVLEARSTPGGLLRREEVGGVPLDVGVEAVLARRPEGVELVHRLGLGDRLVSPTAAAPAVWRRDGVRRLPAGTVMGVPGHGTDLSAALRPDEVAETRRVMAAAGSPGVGRDRSGDVSVAEAVLAQAGRAVLDVLVEPLLGGVHAGRTDELSLRSTVPGLWAAWRRGEPFAATVDAVVSTSGATAPAGPVFTGLAGGMTALVDAGLAALEARGVEVRTDVLAHRLARVAGGWQVRCSPADGRAPAAVPTAGGSEVVAADAVVVALPTRPALRLLAEVAPEAARLLGGVPVVSVAVVALALRGDVPERSGLLVPPSEAVAAGVHAKAVTFSTRKWGWLAERAGGQHLVRVSFGRRGEEAVLRRSDAALADLARADLSTLLAVEGLDAPDVVDARVVRWGGALPQHVVGHTERVAGIRRAVADAGGLAVAGGWTDGVGVPACIGSGRAAARAVLTA